MEAIINEAASKMEKTISSFEGALGKLRTGRANPAILAGIMCDYYGDKIELTSICQISMPEGRQLLIHPYSREDMKCVLAALSSANLGINPQAEADSIRLIVPPLTEDIRKDIAKQAKALGEEGKVSIRNIRRDYMDLLKEDDSMSDDYRDRVEADLEKAVSNALSKIESILTAKTKDILSI